jgi:hypothetical protein
MLEDFRDLVVAFENLALRYEFVQHAWITDPTFADLHDDAGLLVAPGSGRG